jgi:transposase
VQGVCGAAWKKTARDSDREYLSPKYSPDLKPNEQFFAKLKHWLRKAAQRTTEAVYDAIGPILDTVSAAECANYFANAGYDQT